MVSFDSSNFLSRDLMRYEKFKNSSPSKHNCRIGIESPHQWSGSHSMGYFLVALSSFLGSWWCWIRSCPLVNIESTTLRYNISDDSFISLDNSMSKKNQFFLYLSYRITVNENLYLHTGTKQDKNPH